MNIIKSTYETRRRKGKRLLDTLDSEKKSISHKCAPPASAIFRGVQSKARPHSCARKSRLDPSARIPRSIRLFSAECRHTFEDSTNSAAVENNIPKFREILQSLSGRHVKMKPSSQKAGVATAENEPILEPTTRTGSRADGFFRTRPHSRGRISLSRAQWFGSV